MCKNLFPITLVALGFTIFVVNSLALVYHWYWQFRWLDVVLHTAGGVFVGLFAFYIYYYSHYVTANHKSLFYLFFLGASSALLVGFLWEAFEFVMDYYVSMNKTPLFQLGAGDMIGDLTFDIIGGLIAALLFKYIWIKN